MLYLQLFCIFAYLFEYGNSVPTDLTCQGVSKRNSIDLYECEFVSSSSTDIACLIYAKAQQNSTVQPVSFVVGFRTVFYLKEKLLLQFNDIQLEAPAWWWCLGIRSSHLSRIDEVPSNAANVMNFPNAVATLMSTLKEALAVVSFHGDAAAGFVQLRDECDPQHLPLDPSCILRLKGSSYVIAPGDEDFSFWDVVFGKMLKLYFETMAGVLESLTFSTTLTGPEASAWMRFLEQTNVRTLNASYNNFNGNNGVLPRVFKNLSNLTHVYLQNCKLTGIDRGNFDGTPNLEFLDLSGNVFTTPPGGLGALKHLRTLNLGVAPRQVVRFDLGVELQFSTSLRNLRLAGQPISGLSGYTLPTSLETLDLTDCGLNEISSDSFSQLVSLQLLILTSNQISSLHPSTFETLKSGAKVILSKNNIKSGQNLIIKDLDLIDLSENKITKPYNIITNGTLKHLDISNNYIINWTSPLTFNSKYYHISNVNLSNNNIPIIDYILAQSLNKLKSVDVGGNQFNCQDCSLLEFKNWINTTKTEILVNGYKDPIRCSLPVQQKGEILMKAAYNVTACDVQPINLLLAAGLPVAITFTLIFIIFIVMYTYRFEIVYIKHLYRVKRSHETAVERSGCKYDVFVSYSGKDRDWVIDVLLPGLENPKDRFALCLHERDFPLGSFIMDNIVSCIDQSRRVILVLSNNYVKSEWCRWELQMAQHRIFEQSRDFLVLLQLERLERSAVPLHLRVLMDSRTFLEWPRPPDGSSASVDALRSFWQRLKLALGTALAFSATPEEDARQIVVDTASDHERLVPFEPIRL